MVPDAGAYVRDGAAQYDYHCASCHGATGRGLAEARTAFPESDRRCERCHRPNNPAVLPPSALRPNDAFSLGRAPALLGEEAELRSFGSAVALYDYLRATMPRFAPGSLREDTYLRITAFLSAAAGADVPQGPWNRETAAQVPLR